MPTREQVLSLLSTGHSYATAARELHIPAGLAFMIATGRPADASGAPPLPESPELSGSSQQLVNPPAVTPTRNAAVMQWVRERAARELTPGR
jgi:hypothetical protein